MSIVNEKMTALADAIREKSGATGALTLDQMTTEVQSITVGNSDPILQNKTVTPTTNEQTITADDGYDGLDTVTVEGDANLVAENIINGISIFGVNGTATAGGENTDIEDAMVTKTLTTYINSRVTTVGQYAFAYCSRLTSIDLPNVEGIGNNAFAQCSSLTEVSLPALKSIQNLYAFSGCSALTQISLPICSYIRHLTFQRCSNLSNLYLLSSSVCQLAASNAFSDAGITSSTGNIYVPASLVDAYKSATNWTYFSDRIYPYEG